MIRSALQNTYIKACLNPTRTTTIRKFTMSTTLKSFVTSVEVPKVSQLKCVYIYIYIILLILIYLAQGSFFVQGICFY
jgi:hypothetical protein